MAFSKILFLALLQILFLAKLCIGHTDNNSNRSFVIDYKRNTFLKDGKPFRYVSGSVHYFRSVESRWDGILRKCRLAGLNAISTYIEWKLHQHSPEEKFTFEANSNLFKFIETAQKNDLLVILRPGPYLDAEGDMIFGILQGGFPAWLLWEKPGISLRTKDKDYINFVGKWYNELLPRLRPYLYENGGPVIMMQVENEYGWYGCDKNYTGILREMIRSHLGDNLVLFSTDPGVDHLVKCGCLPGVYPTIDFGPQPPAAINKSFAVQRKYAPSGPLVNSEFYTDWLDHWQKPHHKTSTEVVTSALEFILVLGSNVNLYMFHGGTSFGFSSGANIDGGIYEPNPYDYDAPLDEAGDPTEKYFAIKKVVSKHIDVPKENPVVSPKGKYGKVVLTKLTGVHSSEFITLFSKISSHSKLPQSFEELEVASGFVLYQVQVKFLPSDPALLSAPQLKDRAYVYVDKVFQGVLSRQERIFSLPVMVQRGNVISLLVENQGTNCFGKEISESKGPGINVTLGGQTLELWEILTLGEIDGKKLNKYSAGLKSGLVQEETDSSIEAMNGGSGSFFVGNFTVPLSKNGTVLDTYVRLDGFSKGMVWINGFNLGRYWPVVGPQVTLYLPAPLLKPYPGSNTFLVFELEKASDACFKQFFQNSSDRHQKADSCFIRLTDTFDIDSPTPYHSTV